MRTQLIRGVEFCLCRNTLREPAPAPPWADPAGVCPLCSQRINLNTGLGWAAFAPRPAPLFVDRHGGFHALFTAQPRSIRYLSGCTNPLTAAAAHDQPRLGLLAQPGNSVHLQAAHYQRWAIDNGVFGKARRGHTWGEADTDHYLRYLTRVTNRVDCSGVLFATAPDVLTFRDGEPFGDAWLTWFQSAPVFSRIRDLGLPAALVAQDGIADADPTSDAHWDMFDAVFLGGSDAFKTGEEAAAFVREAKRRGKWVHMGRVNGIGRLQRAQQMGCDSADGTFIGFGPDVNLPKLLDWLARTELVEPTERRSAA